MQPTERIPTNHARSGYAALTRTYDFLMNYRHGYHAGNFADVFKHAVLLDLLRVMLAKPTPISYFETHAGAGRYALDAEQALITKEYEGGIAKLFGVTGLPPELARLIEQVKAVNFPGTLRWYPGSPALASAMLRPDDRLQLCELEPSEARALKHAYAHDARTQVHAGDGYQTLKALLPPTPRRGLVLIDPPYESHDEFQQVSEALKAALARWATGVYLIWYPIKDGRQLAPFKRLLKNLPVKSLLTAELCVHPDQSALRLNGSGVAIINAPYRFEMALERILTPLHRLLREAPRARAQWQWLKAPS